MKRFLQATLDTGEVVVSEFSKLGNVDRYTTQVYAGAKPFNVWKIVVTVHPASGERVPSRTREMVNGRRIVKIVEVDANNQPIVKVQRGEQGLWQVGADRSSIPGLPAEVQDGVEYPVHRDPASTRRFIIVTAADENGQGEIRFWLDQGETSRAEPIPGVGPADGDEDDDTF